MAGKKDFDEGAKIKRWTRKLENPKAALKQIGMMMVAESKQAFKDERIGDIEWEPRGVPNVFGIIDDFSEGKETPFKRRFEERPVLKNTGALRRSISMDVVSHNEVKVGTNLPYAPVLHKGGPIESKPITEEVQNLLAEWLKKKGSEWADKLSYLTNANWTDETIKATVVARPIVKITKQTIEDINEIVGAQIMESNK